MDRETITIDIDDLRRDMVDRETITIDIDDLRRDMIDYYGSAMISGFPMAVVDLTSVERASGEELIKMAIDAGVDIRKYSV